MGNKKSSHKPPVQVDKAEPVKKRSKKNGGKRKERPFSDPGTILGDDPVGPNFDQFYLRPSSNIRDSDISGKGIAGLSNITPLPAADYDTPQDTPSGAQVDLFKQALSEVLKIWPEYSPVKEISLYESTAELVTTLEQIANRLCQQYDTIKKQAEDFHELKQVSDELYEERDSLKQTLQKRETDVDQLREDVGLLMGELKKRGLDYKLPSRTFIGHDISFDTDIMSNRSDIVSINGFERDEEPVSRARKGSKLFAPTPLLMAEGGRSRSFLEKRVKRLDGNMPEMSDKWVWPESNAPDDLKERVKWLQAALDSEREKSLQRGSPKHSRKQQLAIEELTQKYTSLQHEAFDKVRRQVLNNLGHVNADRQWSFVCSIMEESYNSAQDVFQQFDETVTALLSQPTKPQSSTRPTDSLDRQAVRRKGSVLDNARKYELEQKRRQQLQKVPGSDIPQSVMTEIYSFLDESSELTNVDALIENTLDALRKKYSDCLTATVINQSTITNFIHSACRLSWQFVLYSPPIYVSTEINKFQKQYLVTNTDAYSPGQTVKYYLWPILLRKRHGEVLSKGIVSL